MSNAIHRANFSIGEHEREDLGVLSFFTISESKNNEAPARRADYGTASLTRLDPRLRFTNYSKARGIRERHGSRVGQQPLHRFSPGRHVVEFNLKFGRVVRIPPQLISRSSHTYIHADAGTTSKLLRKTDPESDSIECSERCRTRTTD